MTQTVPLTPWIQILDHWTAMFRMVKGAWSAGITFQTAIFAAQLTGNLLYKLSVVQKMLPPGVGNRDEGMGVSPGRAGSAPVIISIRRPSIHTSRCPRSP